MKTYVGNGLTIAMNVRMKHDRNGFPRWCAEVGVKAFDDTVAFAVISGIPSRCAPFHFDDCGQWCADVPLRDYRLCCMWARAVTNPKYKVSNIVHWERGKE